MRYTIAIDGFDEDKMEAIGERLVEDYVNQTEIDNLEEYFDLFAPEEFKKYREKIKAIDAAHKAKGILT